MLCYVVINHLGEEGVSLKCSYWPTYGGGGVWRGSNLDHEIFKLTAPNGGVWYSTVWYSTVWYSTLW